MLRWRGLLLAAFAVACTGSRAAGPGTNAVAARAGAAPNRGVPVYRFVFSSRSSGRTQALDSEHVAGFDALGEARIVVAADGSIERAPTPAGDSLMGGVPVPEHLGKGFLFWSHAGLYRARTFAGPLEPVAALRTNVIGVEFGPSSLLLFTRGEPPRAYALEPVRPVAASPPSVLEIAAAGAERAVAFDAVGRALASIDGGRSWQDVTAALGETAWGLKQEDHEIGFALGEKVAAWLQKDGTFVRRELSTVKSSPAERQGAELLTSAVSAGLPLSSTHALAVDATGIKDVDLVSGQASALTSKSPYGSSCVPVSLAEKGLLVCYGYDAPGPSLAVVSQALSGHPKLEKVFRQKPPLALGDDALVVGAACSGQPAAGVACVREPGGWVEVNLQSALGGTWEPFLWVPKAKGGVAALVLERDAQGPSTKLALVDGASGALTPFDATLEETAPHGFGHDVARNFVVLADGTLRGFTTTHALSVDAKGHVSRPTRIFEDVASAGPCALAQDKDSRLWQSTNYGESWLEVARPPFEPALPPPPADSAFAQKKRWITCSPVGCVIPHETELGSWLRLGWPVDAPRAQADPPLSEKPPPLPTPTLRSAPVRPKLRCTAPSAPRPQSPARPLLTTSRAKGQNNARYGDVFLKDTRLNYGLRGLVHIDQSKNALLESAFERLVATKASLVLEFVAPFDPTARVVRTQGPLDAWARLLTARPRNRRDDSLDFDPFAGGARPVLGAAPGRADGALFVSGSFSFAVSRSGKIHPIRPACRADSGYFDAHGKLFIACGSDDGATTLEDNEHERTLLRLGVAERFRSDSGPGMRFFPPGEQLLTHTDSLAVAQDGKLALVRITSGSEPPSPDAPAWLLSAGAPPLVLAPWASLEPATSPACAKGDGYRTLVQTLPPWLEVEGARASNNFLGMSAIVRWSPARVCLEAVEIGTGEASPNRESPLLVTLVAHFGGKGTSSAFIGTTTTESVHEMATCELVSR